MPKKSKASKKPNKTNTFVMLLGWIGLSPPKGKIIRNVLIFVVTVVVLASGTMYGLAQYYINKHKNEPIVFGATFIPTYAESFGLDPKETMSALINDLGLKRLRLVSYWDEYEKEPGNYNFDGLDWQFRMAEKKGVDISLAIGLRQPRWPECHMPPWAERMTKKQWREELKKYMKVVIDRYKNSPSLVEYQLENEFFMKVFGICPDHSRERLIDEYNFVKNIDPSHPVVISRSNNWIGLPLQSPRPDKFGISVYKRVWDRTITKRYYEYPLPGWFYASLAGGGELLTGRDMFIHELQTESWLPDEENFAMNDINSIAEQNKSLNSERLKKRLDYAESTGMRTLDLWGVEWWYWRKLKANDSSLWNAAKEKIQEMN